MQKISLIIIAGLTFALIAINEVKAIDKTDTIVFVVRHAEKDLTFTGYDKLRPLSGKGDERARTLAKMLIASNLSAVYHTEYKRTKDTGAYTTALYNLTSEVCTPVNDLLHKIRNKHTGQSVLVIGHSNTVPDI